MVAVNHQVFIGPARARGVRSDGWMNGFWQPPLDLLHVLEHARARPIDVRAVFENDINVGVAEHRLRAHGLDVRGSEHGGHDGVSHLVFQDVRRHVPFRVDDDLNVGNVRESVEGNAAQ